MLLGMHAHAGRPHRRSNLPHLWARARAHFARALDRYEPRSLARRDRPSRTQADAFDFAITPIEKMIRALLVSSAVSYLLMTGSGRRLRRRELEAAVRKAAGQAAATARRDASPPGSEAGIRSRSAPRRIAYPGWNTLALQPRTQPQPQPETQRPHLDRERPESWTCAFRIIGPVNGPTAGNSRAARPLSHRDASGRFIAAKRRTWAMSLAWDEAAPRGPAPPPKRPPPPDEPCSAAARRVEALRRILANPEPHIRRLAAKLAGLGRNAVHAPDPDIWERRYHLSPLWDDWLSSWLLVTCAIRALDLSG
jgi:hypothetical protein